MSHSHNVETENEEEPIYNKNALNLLENSAIEHLNKIHQEPAFLLSMIPRISTESEPVKGGLNSEVFIDRGRELAEIIDVSKRQFQKSDPTITKSPENYSNFETANTKYNDYVVTDYKPELEQLYEALGAQHNINRNDRSVVVQCNTLMTNSNHSNGALGDQTMSLNQSIEFFKKLNANTSD